MKKIIVGLVVLIAFLGMVIWSGYRENQYISYTEMIASVEADEVSKITIHAGENVADVELKDGTMHLVRIPSIDSLSEFITSKNKEGSSLILETNETKDAFEICQRLVTTMISIVVSTFEILLILVIIVGIIKAIKKDSKNENNNSSSFKEMFDTFSGTEDFAKETTSTVKFADVAGINEEKAQLQEIVEFLKEPKKYQEMGVRMPKGVLLSGMPGTGKTLLAKAIAGESGVPFFQVNGASFEEKYVGVGASRVRKIFKNARAKAPSIIFIDEFDAVAVKRYEGNNNNSEQTLNMLLSEMDGFKESGVIVIAATNHEEVLDEAITRPGRFDRKVFVPMPDVKAREEILLVHAQNKKMSKDVSIVEIAKKTVGFSGAELENLLNESAILAVNRDAKNIERDDIDEAFARIVVGLEKKNRPITKKERKQTAFHEAGHAIVSMILCPDTEIMGISIIPRGHAGGYNLFNSTEKMYQTREDIISQMAVTLGGKAAEEIFLKIRSSGPSSDMRSATKMAYNMVTKYGMNEQLITSIGDAEFDSYLLQNRFSQIEETCNEAYEIAKNVLIENKFKTIKLASTLFKRECLSAEEIKEFIKENEFIEQLSAEEINEFIEENNFEI